MIKNAVESFLTTPHTGVLMISGNWGTGKSYFVKHQLLDMIGNVECPEASKSGNIKEVFKNKILNLITKNGNNYLPVMISLFGIGSIKELESAIMGELLNSINGEATSKIKKIWNGTKKVLEKSEKLKEYLDIVSLIDYRPGVDVLPKQVIIVLDDLERFDDKITETEILGFINNLSENIGLKVIVIANEEYLNSNKRKFGAFKEKVVEKTLYYSPNIPTIAKEMIASLKDTEFKEFIDSSSLISSSFDPEGSVSPKDKTRVKQYLESLSNLRTLKFAINHFNRIFTLVKEYAVSQEKHVTDFKEELEYFWFSILAISMEMKSNRLTHDDVKSFSTFNSLASVEIDFEGDLSEESDLFGDESVPDSVENQKKKNPRHALDKAWFYEYYFRNRGCGLLPIASPGILYYLIDGILPDVEKLINVYREEKIMLLPTSQIGDRLISLFMQKMLTMDNDEFSKNLEALWNATKNGEISGLTDFVNATTYLIQFRETMQPVISEDSILDGVKSGVDKWFSIHSVNDLEKSRFQSVKDMINWDKPQIIYNYITDKIEKQEIIKSQEEMETLKEIFVQDLRGFSEKICPIAFKTPNTTSISVTWAMNHSVLNVLDDEIIRQTTQKLSISDAAALSSLLENRYSIDGISGLKEPELKFWQTVKDAIEKDAAKTPGLIFARQSLIPKLNAFLKNSH